MDDKFYNELFKYFCIVARRTNATIASDENLCREIFHERVLFPKRVKDINHAVNRIRGSDLTFKTPKAYSNWLYTVFKNAVNEYCRSEQRERKSRDNITPEHFEQLPDPEPDTHQEDRSGLQKRAKELINKFTREEKQLLALRYREGKTQEETARFLSVSTSTISRHEAKIKQKLSNALSQEGSELEQEDQLVVLEIFLNTLKDSVWKVR